MRKREMKRLLGATAIRVDEALHELGVPGPEYPAPIANTVDNLGRLWVLTKRFHPDKAKRG